MAINRFYNPSRGQYISQFIPNELPAELMLGIIGKKEKEQEAKVSKLQALQDQLLKVGAIEGALDERVRDDYKNKLTSFIDQSSNIDFSNPNLFREYSQLLRHFNPSYNQELSKIHSQYEYDKEALERISKLKEDQVKGAEEMYWDYMQRRGKYIEGEGFKGNISLGDKDISEGIDIQKASEDLVNNLKANSTENTRKIDNELLGSSYYSATQTGVSNKRIQDRVTTMMGNILQSPLGKQLEQQFYMIEGKNSLDRNKLSSDEKNKLTEKRNSYIWDKVVRAGKEYAYSEYSDTKAEAFNDQERKRVANEKESKSDYNIFTSSLGPTKTTLTASDIDDQIKTVKDNQYSLYKELKVMEKDKIGTYSTEQIENKKRQAIEFYNTLKELELRKDKHWNSLYEKSGLKKKEEIINKTQNELWNNLTFSQKEMVKNVTWGDEIINFMNNLTNSHDKDDKAVLKYFKDVEVIKKYKEAIKDEMEVKWQEYYQNPTSDNKVTISQNAFNLPNKVGKDLSEHINLNFNTGSYSFYNPETGTPYMFSKRNKLENIESNVQMTINDYENYSGNKNNKGFGITANVIKYKWDPKTKTNKPIKEKVNLIAVPNSNLTDLNNATIANELEREASNSTNNLSNTQRKFLIEQSKILKDHSLASSLDDLTLESSKGKVWTSTPINYNQGLRSKDHALKIEKKEGKYFLYYYDVINKNGDLKIAKIPNTNKEWVEEYPTMEDVKRQVLIINNNL